MFIPTGSVFENRFSNSAHHAGRDANIEVEPTDGGFVVRDDGPGIDAEERTRVFEYGYTASRRKADSASQSFGRWPSPTGGQSR